MATAEKTKEEMHDIGALAHRYHVGIEVLGGVMAANEWKPGKQVTEKAFKKALYEFQKAPISGGK